MNNFLYPTELGTYKADGLAGHFIASRHCLYRLHHHILSQSGKRYRISSVGLFLIDDEFENLSALNDNSKFETMVFKEKENNEGFLEIENLTPVETKYCNDSITATEIHYKLIERYLEK